LSKWALENMGDEKFDLFFSLAWACWTIRNKVVLGNENPNAAVLIDGFIRLVRDYEVYSKKVFHTSVQTSMGSFEK